MRALRQYASTVRKLRRSRWRAGGSASTALTKPSWLFVPAEQLVCYLLCEGVLVWAAVRGRKVGFRAWVPALVGLLACGVIIAGEFALDGKIMLGDEEYIPQWVTYGVMALSLAAMAVGEHFALRRIQAEA